MFAALARAAGFPTQIVTMSDPANDIFHYWNRVFIKGKWLVVDTTNDNKLESDSDLIIDYSYFLITDQKAAEIGAKNHSYFSIWWSK
jgi:transglutaminase/protease-like cytokinesis protein 3